MKFSPDLPIAIIEPAGEFQTGEAAMAMSQGVS